MKDSDRRPLLALELEGSYCYSRLIDRCCEDILGSEGDSGSPEEALTFGMLRARGFATPYGTEIDGGLYAGAIGSLGPRFSI
jgi:hypothetical protein